MFPKAKEHEFIGLKSIRQNGKGMILNTLTLYYAEGYPNDMDYFQMNVTLSLIKLVYQLLKKCVGFELNDSLGLGSRYISNT